MKRLLSSRLLIVASVCAVIGCSKTTLAALPSGLIAYEPFDYPVGSELVGLDGGFGWTGPWTPRPPQPAPPVSSQMVRAGSLPAPPGLPTLGNHAFFMGEPAFTTRDVRRPFPEVSGSDGTTLWVSFLGQRVGETTDPLNTIWPNNPYPRSANLSFFDSDSQANPTRSERFAIGNSSATLTDPLQYDEWSLIPEGQPFYREGPDDHAPRQSELSWAVLRIDFLGDHTIADNAWLWLNPDPLGGEPTTDIADVTILSGDVNALDYSGVDYVRPFAGNADGIEPMHRPAAAIVIDEIRIGTTWRAVAAVPEPSTGWLAIFITLIIARHRPRRRFGS